MGGKGRTGKEGEVEGGAGMRRGGEGREGRGMGRGRNGPPLFGSRPCRRTVDTLSAESGVPGHIPPGQFPPTWCRTFPSTITIRRSTI